MVRFNDILQNVRERVKTLSSRFFTPKEFHSALFFLGLGVAALLYRGGAFILHECFPKTISEQELSLQRTNDSTFAELSKRAAIRDSLRFWIPEDSLDRQERNRLVSKSKKELNLVEHSIAINSADSAAFQQLPGIGEKMASRIVQYRNNRGKFRHLHELMNVEGIGDQKYKRMEPYLKLY